MSATADQGLAELQRAYEELRLERDTLASELQTRSAALVQRNTERDERIEHQSAIIDVLKAMSTSPGDPRPVFDLITRRAQALCNSDRAGVFEYDGELVHIRSAFGRENTEAFAEFAAAFPMAPTRAWIPGGAILDKQIIHIRDMDAEPDVLPVIRSMDVKSVLAIPLLRDGAALGAFAINTAKLGGFSDSQIELLKTFAEQAVIAITSAETFRTLQTRTSDLQESLDYQTATSDVLKVISRSTFDLEPVLNTLVETAAKLCDAEMSLINRRDGDLIWAAANYGYPPEVWEYWKATEPFPPDPDAVTVGMRTLLEGRVVHIHDVTAVPGYPPQHIALGKQRTTLGVPLLRAGEVIGNIGLARQRVEPFTDRQIALLENFADQAVIAIENTRLITEQREALEQRTATAEVLQVINANPGNLIPVFEAILEKAHSLCGVAVGALMTFDGEFFRAVAIHGFPETHENFVRRPFYPNSDHQKLIKGERLIHLHDVKALEIAPDDEVKHSTIGAGVRTLLAVPLRKDGNLLGFISACRLEVNPFSEREIVLLESFAGQAVIAMENARLLTEQREALDQQTATAEVLQVINASPGNLAPVFETMLDRAMRLCEGVQGTLWMFNGEQMRATATAGYSSKLAAKLSEWREIHPFQRRLLQGEAVFQIVDLAAEELYRSGNALTKAAVDVAGIRTVVFVGLVKDATTLGGFTIGRHEVRAFTDKQIALLKNFAAQGVIAIENARLLSEQREALEQQTATAEVLQVINASPGDLKPVFDAVIEKAIRLCDVAYGALYTIEGGHIRIVASRGIPSAFVGYREEHPPTARPGSRAARLLETKCSLHIPDLLTDQSYKNGDDHDRAAADMGGARTLLLVPLLREGEVCGIIVVYRQEVRAFSNKHIVLLENFAAQAVIAMENARLLEELRQRQEELRITFENMGDGVAMFDETQHLVAWNSKFQEIYDLPDTLLKQHRTYEEYLRFLAGRGDFGPGVDTAEQISELVATTGRPYGYERTRPDGRVIEIRRNPVPDGGFVLIFSDITERKRSEVEIRAARDAAEAAYRDLKAAQASLIQAEKMASLGQLTAGIAHEIKNPLNFVNNFASLSVDLLDELKQTAAPGLATLDEASRAEVDELTNTLASNLDKINEHGRRADGIVRGMLEHSRGSSGERRQVELNALVDEALNLAYHGARAQNQSFSVTLRREFDEGIAPITLAPQDVTRVLLNLISNGFYAARERQRTAATVGFDPTLKVSTHDLNGAVEIRVRDNGIGIPPEIKDRLFQPFFTTKPPGEGTGLGLSMSYDIITQQHGGSISVHSKVGEYSEFTVRLPRSP